MNKRISLCLVRTDYSLLAIEMLFESRATVHVTYPRMPTIPLAQRKTDPEIPADCKRIIVKERTESDDNP